MALLRLARRALHRASASAPTPLASVSSNSRGHLMRFRFCTSSSAAPHFMVDYLVSTCGLPPDKAAKAAPRFAHLNSPGRPDAVLACFRSKGLSPAQVRAVVSCYPALLLSDVDKTIAPKFGAVRSAGFTRAETAQLFALCPPALTWRIHTNLLPRILFWLDILGSTRLLMKWLNRTWLLSYTVDLLLRNLSALRDVGVPQESLTKMLRLHPMLIMQTPDRVRALIDRVDACGVPRGSGTYVWALFTLNGVSRAKFQAKRDALMSGMGCTEQEFVAMFRRAPCFLFMSADLLLRKVEFLKATVGCDVGHIVRTPLLLTLSLSKRMVPRCRVIEVLRSKGLEDIGKERLSGVVRLSEAKFMERYILRYSEEAPELLELYPPPTSRVLTNGAVAS